jgi:hypothetical protein
MVTAFSPYPERKVMVIETRPHFATAGTFQSNSIGAKDLAITANPFWRLLAHGVSVLNIVSEFTDRSASCPDPEKSVGFARISRAHQEARLSDCYGECKGSVRVGSRRIRQRE